MMSNHLDDAVFCAFCNRTVGLWLLRDGVFDVEKEHQKWCAFGSVDKRYTNEWQCRLLPLHRFSKVDFNGNTLSPLE
ncbi:unnamed protein product [Gongylonema pulchrum]|uniref:PlsC domain-containing protein n=1 Tax=Gongylonema pulchrum TaxID=637853 RepID=A0A183CVC3_9BILA|nr:unnamed protein product [Gongylonema pulchrum]